MLQLPELSRDQSVLLLRDIITYLRTGHMTTPMMDMTEWNNYPKRGSHPDFGVLTLMKMPLSNA